MPSLIGSRSKAIGLWKWEHPIGDKVVKDLLDYGLLLFGKSSEKTTRSHVTIGTTQ